MLEHTIVDDVTSTESDDNAIKHGHMCLGHLSERGRMELHKKIFKGFP